MAAADDDDGDDDGDDDEGDDEGERGLGECGRGERGDVAGAAGGRLPELLDRRERRPGVTPVLGLARLLEIDVHVDGDADDAGDEDREREPATDPDGARAAEDDQRERERQCPEAHEWDQLKRLLPVTQEDQLRGRPRDSEGDEEEETLADQRALRVLRGSDSGHRGLPVRGRSGFATAH